MKREDQEYLDELQRDLLAGPSAGHLAELCADALHLTLEREQAGDLETALQIASTVRNAAQDALLEEASRLEATLAMRTGQVERAWQVVDAFERADGKTHGTLRAELRDLQGKLAAVGPAETKDAGEVFLHPKFGRLRAVEKLGDRTRVRASDGTERVFLNAFLDRLAKEET